MCKRLFFLISVALLLGMAGNTSAEIKALWDLDEGAGTVAHDSVGGYNGDFVGDPAWVDSNAFNPLTNCGMALEFDGNDAIEVGYYPEFNPTGSFSISLWAFITEWETEWEHSPIGNRSDGSGWCLRRFGPWYRSEWNPDPSPDPNYDVTDALCFTTRGIGHASDNLEDTPSKAAPPNDVWVHIACVYDHENHKKYIYFDGEPNSVWDTNATDANLSPAWQKFYIGARSNQADTDIEAPFTGKIDDVRFYDHALSPGEIIPDYNEARKPDPHNNTTITTTDYTLRWEAGCGVLSADDYHVWFSEDWNDVNKSDPNADEGTTDGNDFYDVNGFVRNKTYYWRIDTIVGAIPYPGYIWKFFVQPEKAYGPDPCDGHGFTAVEPVLSWKAGAAATTGHNVYFGLDFNNVSDANTSDPEYQTILPVGDTNWAPSEDGYGKLDVNTVYYWRIDEVGTTTVKGDVWSFKTVPVEGLGYILREIWTEIDGNAVADLTSSPGYPDAPTSTDYLTRFEGPAVGDNYGSRLHGWLYVWDTNDYTFWIASRDNSELWLSTNDSAYNAVKIASVSALTEDGYTAYFEFTKHPEQQSAPIHLEAGNLYYIMALQKAETPYGNDHVEVAWSTDPNADPNTAEIIDGTYYLIPYLQPTSFSPNPRNDATDVQSMPILNWKPGAYAATHDVYFGTDFNDVNEATISEPCGVFIRQDYDSNSIDIANDVNLLEFNTTYYWRIDDVNTSGPDPCLWKGRVWKFTTGSYHAVEDFERYANTAELKTVWSAHSDVNAASDVLGGQRRGNQAMALKYNNSSSYSEAYADSDGTGSLEFGFNWRLQNVKALSLWLHGIPDLRGSYTGSDPYTLEGDGTGIDNTTYDTCYFFYRTVDNIYPLVQARVDSIEDTDDSAMAGVMLRDNALNASCVYVATAVTPDGRVIFIKRGTAGTNSSASVTVSGITLPHWVRITRFLPQYGQTRIFAEHSENGVNWELVGEIYAMSIGSKPTDIGLCVTSNVYGDMCTAEFSNVYIAEDATYEDTNGVDVGDPNAEVDIGNYVYNDPQPMYVTLQDINDVNWTEYYQGKDANVTQTDEWTQWRLDLKNFDNNGVDPCYVKRMYIGVGDKTPPHSTGSGTVFIDDIRLYLAEFYEPMCPTLQTDLVRDGVVNYKDLKIVTDNWLIYDYNVTPVAPPNEPNLIAWYRLEQDPCDSAGSHHGDANGIKPADYVTGMEGDYALDLKGDANFIETDYNAVNYGIDGNNPRTVTAWAKARSFGEFRGVYEIGGYAEGGQDFSLLTKGTEEGMPPEPNVWRANHEGGPEEWDIDFEYPSLNEWVHFAHTYDGTTVRVYADGYAVASRVLDLNTTDTKTFSIGRYTSWGFAGYFDGIVDDVRIYDYALNHNEAAYIARYPDANEFYQPLELLLMPHDPNINLYDGENPETINFRDIADFGKHWGETQVWPTW